VQTDFSVDATPCYAADAGWAWMPIPFYGSYNDHGWQNDDPGQQHKYDFLAKTFDADLVEVESEKERAASCYSIKKPFDDNKSLGDSIHGNVWNIKGGSWNSDFHKKIACFMVNRMVWDELTSSFQVDYPKKRTYTREAIATSVQGFIDYYKTIMAYLKLSNDKSFYFSQLQFAYHEMSAAQIKAAANLGLHLTPEAVAFIEGKTDKNEVILNDSVPRFILNRSHHTHFLLIDLLVDGVVTATDVAAMYMLDKAMGALRKTFCPQTGEGSQEGICREHKRLMNAMKKMIAYDKKRYD
jgi:hypothetical protein